LGQLDHDFHIIPLLVSRQLIDGSAIKGKVPHITSPQDMLIMARRERNGLIVTNLLLPFRLTGGVVPAP
jgi:hypothetical protein